MMVEAEEDGSQVLVSMGFHRVPVQKGNSRPHVGTQMDLRTLLRSRCHRF